MASLPGDTKSTKVRSAKELSDLTMMELTDSEVTQVFQEIVKIQQKYATRQATPANLDSLRDEILTRMLELGIHANFDPVPMVDGEPPAVEIIGKIPGGAFDKYGFDHEKEQWEVQKAETRNEKFYGEKEKAS
jgi:hypothetical protein